MTRTDPVSKETVIPRVTGIDPVKVQRFHRLLFRWYRRHQRDLPWRKTHDPYKILVSEVMLQQTQVSRVIPKYLAFVDRFPTAQALANAPTADILRLWSGLGYNRRAIFLKRAAEIVVRDWKERWPETIDELQRLPAVGRYTAAAILSFAFNKDVPLADTNIEKVIGRLFIGPDWPHRTEKELLEIVQAVLPKGKSRIFPHAVMDLGAALAQKHPSMAVWHKEFPELFVREKPARPGKIVNGKQPWMGSNRQIRGAILRHVQLGASSMEAIARELSLPRRRLVKLVEALTKDGLVRYGRGEVSLP